MKRNADNEKAHWMLSRLRRQEPYTMPSRHFHNEYELYYLLEGEREIFVKDRLFRILEGGMVFFNQHTIHFSRHIQDSTFAEHERVLIEMRPSFFRRWMEVMPGLDFAPLFDKPYVVLSIEGEPRRQIEYMLRQIESADLGRASERDAAEIKVVDIMLSVAEKAKISKCASEENKTGPAVTSERIDEICEYILEQECDVSLNELSDHFYISRYYLCRLFKQSCGMTIREYIAANRVLRVQRLLETTSLSITEISNQAGYGSISQMERNFRQYTNMTPREFRASYRSLK